MKVEMVMTESMKGEMVMTESMKPNQMMSNLHLHLGPPMSGLKEPVHRQKFSLKAPQKMRKSNKKSAYDCHYYRVAFNR